MVKLPRVVTPLTERSPPMEVLPVKMEASATLRVFTVAPELTVKVPFTTALFERVKYDAERRSKPDWIWGATEYVVKVAGEP